MKLFCFQDFTNVFLELRYVLVNHQKTKPQEIEDDKGPNSKRDCADKP